MPNPLPRAGQGTPMPMARLQNVVRLMARQSNLPASIIKSPRVREYFLECRKAAMNQQPSTSHAPPRGRQQRGAPDDPSLYRNWEGVPRLPYKRTRMGTQF